MKNFLWFLLGFTIVFAPAFAFCDEKNTDKPQEQDCFDHMMICADSCKYRGGMLLYLCYGSKVVKEDRTKCRCIDEN